MSFKLTEAFIEFKANGVQSVAGQMANVSSAAVSATDKVKTLEKSLGGSMAKKTAEAAEKLGAALSATAAIIPSAISAFATLGSALDSLGPRMLAVSSASRSMRADIAASSASIKGMSDAAGQIGAKTKTTEKKGWFSSSTTTTTTQGFASSLKVLAPRISAADSVLGKLTTTLGAYVGIVPSAESVTRSITFSMAEMSKASRAELAELTRTMNQFRKMQAEQSATPKLQPVAPSVGFFGRIGGAASSAIGTLTSFKSALFGAGVAAGAFSAVNMVGQAEQTSVAFEVMLGDAQRAKSMLSELRTFADQSPFTFPGVTAASRTLLQFGVNAGSILPTIKRIGDIAAGDEEKMSRLSLAFGQMTAAGRLMGQDLLQMVNAGFNPLQEISRTTGESMAALKARMEAGGISAAEVAKAFETATSQGGKFFGMTERMSKTTLGRLSTLKDTAMSSVRAMTEPFMGGVNSLISGAGTLLGEVQAMLTPSFAIIGKTFGDIMGGMNFKFDGASIGASLAGVTERVVGVFKGIYDAVSPIVLRTVAFITDTWQQIGPSVFSIADSVMSSIVPAINFLAPMVPTILKFVGAFLTASAVPTIFAAVGGAIAAIASPVGIAVASIGGLIVWLNSGSDRANYFKGIIDDVFSSVGKYVIDSIDTVAFAFRNWDTLLDLAIANAGLFIDNTLERFRAFGENISNVATWLGDNWLNIFKDMASGTATILENIGNNLGSFLTEVKSWLSGDGFNFKASALLDGVKFSTQALPDMVKPAIRETTAEIQGLYRKINETEAEFNKRKAATAAKADATTNTSPDSTPDTTTNPQPSSGKQQSSFLGFDALAKRMGDDSPMVKQQKRTNQLLASGSLHKPEIVNELNSPIPADWREQAAKKAAAEAAGQGLGAANNSKPIQGTLEQQLAVFSQAVTALQSLVDMAANKGIKTTGGEAVLA